MLPGECLPGDELLKVIGDEDAAHIELDGHTVAVVVIQEVVGRLLMHQHGITFMHTSQHKKSFKYRLQLSSFC